MDRRETLRTLLLLALGVGAWVFVGVAGYLWLVWSIADATAVPLD